MTAQKNLLTTSNNEDIDPCLPGKFLHLPTIFVGIFRDFFAYPEQTKRWFDGCKHLRYFEGFDPVSTEDLAVAIEIDRFEKYNGVATNQSLPKVLVKRNSVAITGQNAITKTRAGMIGPGANGGIVPASYTGSLISFCLSKTYGQAEFIAAEVAALIVAFSPIISKQLNLTVLQCSQISDIVELTEFPGFFAVPVVTDYNYEDNILLTRDRPPIRSINIVLETQA